MNLNVGQWFEIFKAGDYGSKGSYTTYDLDTMIKNFSAEDQVPIVIGKPKTTDPAFGWISNLKRSGNVLLGKVGSLHEDFRSALQRNHFDRVLVSVQKGAGGPKLLSYGFVQRRGITLENSLQSAFSCWSSAESSIQFSIDIRSSGKGLPSADLAYKV